MRAYLLLTNQRRLEFAHIHLLLISMAMMAFAGNSLLCRMALKQTSIDPLSFTAIRIASGACVLWILMRLRGSINSTGSGWPSALVLIFYAACFAYAYIGLTTAAGVLLLFGAGQATMISYGLWSGERMGKRQCAGLLLAMGGLISLLLPGISTPSLPHSLLMTAAGIAWGIYSLLGQGTGDPGSTNAGDFMRAAPVVVLMGILLLPWSSMNAMGALYAILSGALASGMGYTIWYAVLRKLKASSTGTVQLSVPIIAAIGGIVFLNETITTQLLISSTVVLGGVALVLADG